MDFYETANKRRTVRNFSAPAPDDVLRKIILTGTKAANSGNSQPWEFIVVKDAVLINRLADYKYQCNAPFSEGVAKKQRDMYKNTNIIAACYKTGGGYDWSVWMAIQNMALAATVEGYGILPSTLWGNPKKEAEKMLGLPAGYEMATIVLIGKQKGNPPKIKRRPDFSWLHIDRFGNPGEL